MNTFNIRGTSEGLYLACDALRVVGKRKDSRNGPVLEFPEPVLICYNRPVERVLFYPSRDANPFFHLMEGLWMLVGYMSTVMMVSGFMVLTAIAGGTTLTLISLKKQSIG